MALARSIRGKVHLPFEEGTQAAWLYDALKPQVAEADGTSKGLDRYKVRTGN